MSTYLTGLIDLKRVNVEDYKDVVFKNAIFTGTTFVGSSVSMAKRYEGCTFINCRFQTSISLKAMCLGEMTFRNCTFKEVRLGNIDRGIKVMPQVIKCEVETLFTITEERLQTVVRDISLGGSTIAEVCYVLPEEKAQIAGSKLALLKGFKVLSGIVKSVKIFHTIPEWNS